MLNKLIAAFLLLVIATINGASAALITNSADQGIAQCRLTLVSGNPTGLSASSNTIYLDPYHGNRIALYDTTRQIWVMYNLTAEIGLLLSGLTPGQDYSLYVYPNSGAIAFDTPAAWTNSATPDSQALQDGIIVKASDHSRRYVGMFKALTSSTTRCDATEAFLANAQMRERFALNATDFTSSWYRYSTGVAAADYNTTDGSGRSTFVQAVPGLVSATAYQAYNVGSGDPAVFGIAMDSTTAFNFCGYMYANFGTAGGSVGANSTIAVSGAWNGTIGDHYIQKLEQDPGGGMTGMGSYNGLTVVINN